MLRQKLVEDQIQSLKSRDADKLTTLRYILSQIKNKEIEKKAELSDEETVVVLKKIAKELKESIDAFQKGSRPDLVEQYKKQLVVVSVYLPPEISDDELKNEIDKLISANQTLYQQNPKAIIGLCMKELKSKADPSRIMKMLSPLSK